MIRDDGGQVPPGDVSSAAPDNYCFSEPMNVFSGDPRHA